MLAEVAASSLSQPISARRCAPACAEPMLCVAGLPRLTSAPLCPARTRHTRRSERALVGAPQHERELSFDHLVLALRSVSNYLGMREVQAEAFDFKSLGDAMRIRNHVIDLFERADRERDPAIRQALLTFVVAGGGFAGAELAGGLNDFTRGMLAITQHSAGGAADILVHSRDRILPS